MSTISAVYEGVNADSKTHIVRLADGTRLTVHDCFHQKHLQPSSANIPQTLLDCKNEVGTGISQEEAQRLARPGAKSSFPGITAFTISSSRDYSPWLVLEYYLRICWIVRINCPPLPGMSIWSSEMSGLESKRTETWFNSEDMPQAQA